MSRSDSAPTSRSRRLSTGSEDVLVHGELYLDLRWKFRDDCVSRRQGVLCPTGFNFSSKPEPSIWALYSNCVTTAVSHHRFRVLNSSNFVWSQLYKNSKRTLYFFRINWPSSSRKRTLAFDTLEVATQWHMATTSAISALASSSNPSRNRRSNDTPTDTSADLSQCLSETNHRRSGLGLEGTPLPATAPAALTGYVPIAADPSTMDTDSSWSHLSRSALNGEGGGGGSVRTRDPSQPSILRREDYPPVGSDRLTLGSDELDGDSDVLDRAPDGFYSQPNTAVTGHMRTHFGRFLLANGLAIWKEDATPPLHLESYMASQRILGSPRLVARTLLRLGGVDSCFWALSGIQGIRRESSSPESTLFFKATITPPGPVFAAFMRPRDVFLKAVTREDESGTYFVLFQSVDAETVGVPVIPGHREASIASMGFTVAPMKHKFRSGGGAAAAASRESLVTIVLSIDLGGWLTATSALRYVLPCWRELQFAWVESLLMTVCALQHTVDQHCFEHGQNDILDAQYDSMPPFPSASTPSLLPAISSIIPSGPALPVPAPVPSVAKSLPAPTPSVSPTAAPATGNGNDTVGDSTELDSRAVENDAMEAADAAAGSSPPRPHPDACVDTWLSRKYYSSPPASNFRVRGPSYLSDRVKVTSEEAAFRLTGIELMKANEAVYHISRYLPIVRRAAAAFSFVLCFTLPYNKRILHLVMVFDAQHGMTDGGASDRSSRAGDVPAASPFETNLARFLDDKNLRDTKLKLIPSLTQGSWIVRQAVGQTPVMLGKRLKTEYFTEESYFEADIDISANSTAASVTSMVAGAIKSLVFDIAILLEGHSTEELPERILGTVRLDHLDLSEACELDTTSEVPLMTRASDGAPRASRRTSDVSWA